MSKSHVSSTREATLAPSRYRQAFEATAKERDALSADELRPMTVDIPSTVAMALGALPQIASYEAAMRGCPFSKRELAQVERIEDYVLALGHAHAVYVTASAPEQELTSLNEAGLALRETLLVDAQVLARHGLLDGTKLTELRQVPGYKQLAFDLLSLGEVFRAAWPTIQGKTPIDLETIGRAEALADQLLVAVGARDQAPAVVAQATLERQRAFTVFLRAYDQVRRALTFVRWNEGDVDAIAPSVYAGRGNANHKKKDDPSTTPSTTPPAASTSAPPASAATPHPPAVSAVAGSPPELPSAGTAAE